MTTSTLSQPATVNFLEFLLKFTQGFFDGFTRLVTRRHPAHFTMAPVAGLVARQALPLGDRVEALQRDAILRKGHTKEVLCVVGLGAKRSTNSFLLITVWESQHLQDILVHLDVGIFQAIFSQETELLIRDVLRQKVRLCLVLALLALTQHPAAVAGQAEGQKRARHCALFAHAQRPAPARASVVRALPDSGAIQALGIVVPNAVGGVQCAPPVARSYGFPRLDCIPTQRGPRATGGEIPQGHLDLLVATVGQGELVLFGLGSDGECKIWLAKIERTELRALGSRHLSTQGQQGLKVEVRRLSSLRLGAGEAMLSRQLALLAETCHGRPQAPRCCIPTAPNEP